MEKKEIVLALLFFIVVIAIFFYKVFLYGYVPFPGDLLIAEYNPWRTYSYLGYVPGSFPNKAQYFDTLRQLYPWKTFTIELIKNGQLPLWNPYNFSGAPLLANFQSAIFYPLNALYLLLPQITAWALLVIFQPLSASFFAYLFARKIGISTIGSVFAALSYAFSSFMTVWLEYNTIGHVILWLPLALLSIEHLLQRLTIRWSLIFIASLTFPLFAGHPQVFSYLFVFVFAFALYRLVLQKKQKVFFLAFSFLFLLPLGLGAIQLVPGIELIRESARSAHAYEFLIDKILIQPWQLAMLFVPDFFGNPAARNYWPQDTYVGKVTAIGLIPLFFVLLTIVRKRNQFSTFFQGAAVVVLLLATSNLFTQLLYKIELPILSASSPTLFIFIFCFSLSMLCGFGVDIWRKEQMSLYRLIRWVLSLVLIFIALWAALTLIDRQHISTALRNLLYETAVLMVALAVLFVGTINVRLKLGVLIFLLLIHCAALWRSFEKFNPFVPSDLVFPKAEILDVLKNRGVDRFWTYGTASIEPNFATQHGLFSPEGYDPLYPRRYGEFIQSSKDGKVKTQFTRESRSDAVITPGLLGENLLANRFRLKVLDLLGVKYVLDRVENKSTEKTFPQDRFSLLHEVNGWRIFENKRALPRAFLASDYRFFKSSKEFEELFFAENFDSAQTVFLEEDVPAFGKAGTSGQASIVSYNPDTLVVTTKSEGDAILFLSDTYYPGWKAFLDGKATKIYRANYAFRAVVVPKGEHTVFFSYKPQSYSLGVTISGVSVLATVLFLLFLPKWQRTHIR